MRGTWTHGYKCRPSHVPVTPAIRARCRTPAGTSCCNMLAINPTIAKSLAACGCRRLADSYVRYNSLGEEAEGAQEMVKGRDGFSLSV